MSFVLVQELDSSQVESRLDSRGVLRFFSGYQIQELHVGSLRPGTVRGQHSHDYDEVLCILGGAGFCQLEAWAEDGTQVNIPIQEEIKIFKVSAGVWHALRNTGDQTCYLLSFMC
ncbi:MAG: cupin domain-containing protein [Desulfohalobiaceae bacterium]